jgi:hypothetical protein
MTGFSNKCFSGRTIAGGARRALGPVAALALLVTGPVPAQDLLPNDSWQRSWLGSDHIFDVPVDVDAGRPRTTTPRLRLFGMPAGFLASPLGLQDDDDVLVSPGDPFAASFQDDSGPDNIQFALGNDNPFFDTFRPGNIGGIGYYQVYSQWQVLDLGSTSMCLNMRAFTPAGIQSGGMPNGPTVVCPSLAWFQELARGTALQGFVSQNVNCNPRWDEHFKDNMYYGLALQWQVPRPDGASDGNLYFFLQAMGRNTYGFDPNSSQPLIEVMPGVQWRVSDNCWLSLGGTRHGLVSCYWHF